MRLNLVLVLAVLASAIYLVAVQYDSRRLFAELDKAHSDARRLEVEYERLQVQKRAQATPARVERLAKEKLQMRQATPGITMYVSYTDTDTDINMGTVAVTPASGSRSSVATPGGTP